MTTVRCIHVVQKLDKYMYMYIGMTNKIIVIFLNNTNVTLLSENKTFGLDRSGLLLQQKKILLHAS